MACICPLLSQPTVLLRDQIHNKGWMPMDQGQEPIAVKPDQGEWCQGLRIPAVTLIRGHQILVEEQFPDAVTDAGTWTTLQLHKPLFHDVDGINTISSPEHRSTGWQRQAIDLPLFADQRQRCLGMGGRVHTPWTFMGCQQSPDVARMIAHQSTIQLQLLLAVTALQPVQGRQLRRAGSPVVTDHQPGELWMHLQPTQTTPAQGSPVT